MIRCPRCHTLFDDGDGSCSHCGFAPERIEGFPAWAPELAHGGGGFEAHFFGDLAAVEDANFWFRGRNRLLLWALETYFPDMKSFLEVGCGTGYVLRGVAEAFPEATLTGSEVFVAGLTYASERVPGARFVQMDARSMPYRSEFDVVGAFDVLEHIDDDEAALASLFEAVKPGGGLLISVPQHMWLWSALDDLAHHQRRYSARELRDRVNAAGFQILRDTSFVSLLLPLMAASRLTARSGNADAGSEFGLPRPVNFAFECCLSLERQMIKRGLDLPVGGSRLVVARRPH